MSLRLPPGPKRMAIHRKRAARGEPAIEVEMIETGERFYALDRVEWGGGSLRRNPDPNAKPAFFLELDAEVTLT